MSPSQGEPKVGVKVFQTGALHTLNKSKSFTFHTEGSLYECRNVEREDDSFHIILYLDFVLYITHNALLQSHCTLVMNKVFYSHAAKG